MNHESAKLPAQLASADQPDRALLTFSLLLSSTPRGARLARLLADEQLRRWGIESEAAEHIVAELAANAATHGRVSGRDFRLALAVIGDTLRIEVTDTRGECLPHLQHPTSTTESGRGLLLVEALSDRWGAIQGRTPGKIVWAELRCVQPEPVFPRAGDSGAFLQGTSGRKNPHQAPPLPPAAHTHSGG